MRRSLKILFCLSLLAFVIGIGNIGAKAEEKYNVWIGSTQVTSSNKNYIKGEIGGYASYDPSTKALNCYNFKGVKGLTPSNALIEANGDLYIFGNMDMSGASSPYGIYTGGALQINANVTIPGDTAIFSKNDINFQGGTVTAKGTKYGIYLCGDNSYIAFNGGKIKASGEYYAVFYEGVSTHITFSNDMRPYCDTGLGGFISGYARFGIESGFIADEDVGGGAENVLITREAPENYSVWIGEKKITSENKDRIEGKNGGYASYDPNTKTLTFHDFKDVKDETDYLVYSKEDLNIKGKASFSEKPFYDMFGIRSDGVLSVSGKISVDTRDRALYGMEGIVISGKDTVVSVSADAFPCSGIYSCGKVEIKDGKVSCLTGDESDGILAQGVIISGGTIEITAVNGDGIYCGAYEELNIKGGKVSIKARDGVYANKINIAGGEVAIEAEYAAIEADDEINISSDLMILEPVGGKIITDENGYYSISSAGTTPAANVKIGKCPITITSNPSDTAVEEGKLAYFDVKVTGKNLNYLWQYKKKGENTWTDWTSKTTTSISVAYAAYRNGMSFRCVITDASGIKLISGEAVLTYTSASSSTFAITDQPKDTTVAEKELAYFSIKAKGEGLKYLWQYKEAGKSTWTDWTSKTTANISVAYAAYRQGMSFRCRVTDKDGKQLISNVATLTYTSVSTLSITEQPKSVAVAENELAYFNIKAKGEGLKYLWQYKEKGKSTWTDWTSKTKADISVAYAAYRNGMSLRCVVTDKNGNKVTSNAATLTYTTALKITTQPVNSTVNKNELAYFTVKAEGKGLTYLWQYKLAGDSTWTDWTSKKAASISVAYAAYRNNMQLRCVVTDSNGNTVTSNVVTLKYNP